MQKLHNPWIGMGRGCLAWQRGQGPYPEPRHRGAGRCRRHPRRSPGTESAI